MLAQAKKDLKIDSLRTLEWDPGSTSESLGRVVEHLRAGAMDTITYYCASRRPKRKWAVGLRMGAIVFGAVAAVLPLLSQIFSEAGKSAIPPAWSSVALAVVAALIATDQFFGFSTAWMRFMTTELRIRQELESFELEWEARRAGWGQLDPTPAQVQDTLAWAKKFASTISALVQEETNAWISEFQNTLRRLDEQAKTATPTSQLGALNVTVKNGALFVDGWELAVDDGAAREYRGSTAALRELLPGTHTIRAMGKLNSATAQAEVAVAVPAGGVATAELILE